MSSCATLPVELYAPIINEMSDDNPTLYNLCLSSVDLRAEAEKMLYAEFHEKPFRIQQLFHRSVTQSPHHAGLVKSYSLNQGFSFLDPSDDRDRTSLTRKFWDSILPAILQALCNLRHRQSLSYRLDVV